MSAGDTTDERNPEGIGLKIRSATREDVGTVLGFIGDLAEYERMSEMVVATEADLQEHLFGTTPRAEVLLAEVKGTPVGFALFFHTFSTFLARPGIYLEDLYVPEEHRGNGYGRALLSRLAVIAVERGCGRLEWSVLNWNEPAIGFYRSLGALPMDEWTVYRLTGDPLESLAASSHP